MKMTTDKAFGLLTAILFFWAMLCVADMLLHGALSENTLVRELTAIAKFLVPALLGFLFALGK